MSRSEIAQNIGESTQGKLTHWRSEFNWKLGVNWRQQFGIRAILTVSYGWDCKWNTDGLSPRNGVGTTRNQRTYASTRSCGSTAVQQAAPARYRSPVTINGAFQVLK